MTTSHMNMMFYFFKYLILFNEIIWRKFIKWFPVICVFST